MCNSFLLPTNQLAGHIGFLAESNPEDQTGRGGFAEAALDMIGRQLGAGEEISPLSARCEGAAPARDQEGHVREASGDGNTAGSYPTAQATSPRKTGWLAAADAVDLSLVEGNCRLKAEGCRWAVQRTRLRDRGASFRMEIAPRDYDLISRGKTANCHLWMNRPGFSIPKDLEQLELAAGCFKVLAAAVGTLKAVVAKLADERDLLEESLTLAAEAQSALMVAITQLRQTPDDEQHAVYHFLEKTSREKEICLRRYHRPEEAVDPVGWQHLQERIRMLEGRVQDRVKKSRVRRKAFQNMRFKLMNLSGAPNAEQRLSEWKRLGQLVDEIVKSGVAPSSPALRGMFIPVINEAPRRDDDPQGFRLLLREIDRYLASQEGPSADGNRHDEEPTAEVQKVAELLCGKGLVLIGGDRRPEHKSALERAFALAELIWVETRPGDSVARFEPYVARPDVVAVMLAIRWVSHSCMAVKKFCDRYDKPLVCLPGGYSPHQVAAQIMLQCSNRLKREHRRAAN